MPAPLGKTPTRKMPKIEVYGLEDSQATRAAIRFFRERRIVVQFVDLRKKPLTADVLARFAGALGTPALLETGGQPPDVAVGGWDSDANGSPEKLGPVLLARLRADLRSLRLPLVRYGDRMTSGKAEPAWRSWLERR